MSPPVPALHDGIALAAPASIDSLASQWGGEPDADARQRVIERIAEPSRADSACLAPLLSRRYLPAALTCAGVLLVEPSLASGLPQGARWVHPHAAWVMASLLRCASTGHPAPRISPDAIVEPGVELAGDIEIGAGALLMSGSRLGQGCCIGPHAVVYGNVVIGRRVSIGAGAVVGRPGFGWVTGPGGEVQRMPQPGGVVIEDDVEVGPLATIDSGTLHPTVLERASKLDAHVHVGHNVRIGAGTIVAAQAGFAGSARIGRGVLVGGQAGVADHAEIGDGARLAGGAGVIGNVPPGVTVAGYPAVERSRWLRSVAKALRGQPT